MFARTRRRADGEQSVSGLMKCLEVLFQDRRNRNLDRIIAPLKAMNWRDTPKLDPLVHVVKFYESAAPAYIDYMVPRARNLIT